MNDLDSIVKEKVRKDNIIICKSWMLWFSILQPIVASKVKYMTFAQQSRDSD